MAKFNIQYSILSPKGLTTHCSSFDVEAQNAAEAKEKAIKSIKNERYQTHFKDWGYSIKEMKISKK